MIAPEVVDIDLLSPEGTVAAFQALNARNVHAIASAFVLIPQPAMDAAAASGVPYMHGNTQIASTRLVEENPERYRNIFMIDPDETFYGSGFIQYLDRLVETGQWAPANNRIHIVQEQIAYTQVISQAAQEAIAASDGRWELAEVTDIQFPVQDWTPVINALKSEGAGVIFVSHWVAAELASFAQQFAYDPTPDSLVYLQYGPSQPEFLDLARGAGEGMIWGTVLGTPRTEEGRAFREAYMAEHGDNMGEVYTASAYDTVMMLAEVWKTTPPEEFDAVGDAIRALRYEGISGTYTFDRPQQRPLNYPWETDELSEGIPHLIYQVQDNEHTIILPDALAESSYQTPRWAQ
jgi:branched-chain amino acid transport system substrate-binding protein